MQSPNGSLSSFDTCKTMTNIILDEIVVDRNRVYYNFSYSPELSSFFRTNQMFLEYEEDMAGVPKSILSIPFIASVIGVAWLENTNLYVDELDSSYYCCLRELREAYRDMYYRASLRGRVVPCRIVENRLDKSAEALLLFGGGVDAHCSFLRHKEKVTHIANIQGWFNKIDGHDKAADADSQHCQEFASRMNVKFDYVRSNFARVVNSQTFNHKYQKVLGDQWWHGLQHSMAFISIAIPLAFKHGISDLIIASSCTKGRIKPCGSFITTDSAFKFAGTGNVLHDAFELSRQQKMEVIVNYQKSAGMPYPLKVCSFNDRNCCECEKCFRTIIEIIAEGGKVQDYGFNIEKPLVSYFQDVMNRRLGLWGMSFERDIYWKDTMRRMRENYDNIVEKEFVDWFLTYDFDTAFKKSLRIYYKKNIISIIKRKLHL